MVSERKFICFIGIDGSGKSSLARSLINDMNNYDRNVEYRWCKFESSVLRCIISIKNMLFIKEKDFKLNYERSSVIKTAIFNKRQIRSIYELFVLIDYLIQIFKKIRLPLLSGKIIICDRYIYDTVVDMAIDLNYTDKTVFNRINLLSAISPTPDIIFWVDVPEEVAYNRKNDIPSLEFLNKKRTLYKKIGNEFKFVNLDGTTELHELSKIIKNHLKPLIGVI